MLHTPLRPTMSVHSENDYHAYQPVATKFMSPVPISTVQVRTRLLAHLRNGLSYPLVLVSAPPGSGKTTLLSQWTQFLANEHVPVAWVSLDASDDEPCCFWNVILTALAQKLPVFNSLQGRTIPRNAPELLTLLIEMCAAQQEPIVLILDDYHVVRESIIQEQMTYLIEHLPPHMHIVLSTQVDPYLPLTRLRGRNQLLEVRMDALRFTYEEATQLLREEMQLPLTAAEIMYLVSHVDGWSAGLRLAGDALYEQSAATDISIVADGGQSYLLDYIVDEVLLKQEEHVQTFLVRTAFLSHFSASLCDTVLGRHDSWRLLQQLERANLFLVVEDDERGWYHYRSFFAEALRARLERTESEIVSELHQRASHWYEQHGFLVDAIEHLCAVRDWEHANFLIERIMQQQSVGYAEASSPAVLQNLLTRLPEVLVQMQSHRHVIDSIPESERQNKLTISPFTVKRRQEELHVQHVSASRQLLDPLSTREMEVLRLIAQGAANEEIANDLVIAPATVKRHVSNILSKLEATNRTQAVACARRLSLLQ